MKKFKETIGVIALGIILGIMLVAPINASAADPEVFIHPYFGVAEQGENTKVLWADARVGDDTFNTITLEGDGQAVLKGYYRNGALINQKVYDLNGQLQIDMTEEFKYNDYIRGIQLQLVTGTEVRLAEATTTNELSEIVNFLDVEF